MWGNILFTTLLCHSNWNKPGFLRFRNLRLFAILLLFVPMQTVARQWKPSSVLLQTSLLLHVSIFLDWAEETKCANKIRDSQASNVFFNEHWLLDSKHHKTHWSDTYRTALIADKEWLGSCSVYTNQNIQTNWFQTLQHCNRFVDQNTVMKQKGR